jgi:hypothetical protein
LARGDAAHLPSEGRAGGTVDAVKLLKEDHDRLKELFAR